MTGPRAAQTPMPPSATGGERRLVLTDADLKVREGLDRHRTGDLDGALMLYTEAMAVDPSHPDALHLGGMILFARGEAAMAAEWISRALVHNPGLAPAHNNLGMVLLASGNLNGAREAFQRAMAADTAFPEPHLNLGLLARRLGDDAAAERHYRDALALNPNYATAHFNLANVLEAQGHSVAAIAAYGEALRCNPNFAAAHNNLGNVLAANGARRQAQRHFEHALAVDPRSPDLHHNLGNLLLFTGDAERAKQHLSEAHRLAPERPLILSSYLFGLTFDEATDAAMLLAAHRYYNNHFIAPLRPVRPSSYPGLTRHGRNPERRLRIGYVSQDFRLHPGGHFLLPVIRHHDRSQFEVFCYATMAGEDENRRTFRTLADHFREVAHLDDVALAELIMTDEIDILVDCMGHLEGSRLPLFGRAPAPVQVSFPIYPATTGVETIGWRIMDPCFAPPGAEAWHSERLVRLPDSHICYQPLSFSTAEPAKELPARQQGHVTFGSFNNVAKLGPRTALAFSRIVNGVPGARLALKWHGIEDCDVVLARFAAAGLPRTQIDLLPWAADPYADYRSIDIALDPLLANGGTTTCDALYMGVPVVSCAGSRPFARVGLGHLTNIGLPELVAHDEEGFVALATSLGRDLPRLENLRHGLRERFLASPLCDQPRYVRNLDAAYREIWRAFCADPA